jgi:hypothetical protein
MGTISETLKTSTDEAIKNFRENFPDVFEPVAKIIDDVAGRIVRGAEDRISAVENAAMEPKREAFFRVLSQAHPDWEAVCKNDPNWSVWLSRPDRYGRKAIDTLKDAQARLDAQVVVNLLTDFKREMGQSSFGSSTPPAPNPGSTGAVTRGFIRQFYADRAKGRYRGKEKEAEAIEARINAAIQAGQVR